MVLATLGCESTSSEVDSTVLVTDGTSFRLDTLSWHGHLWYYAQIPYSFTNRTGSRVYLPTDCYGNFSVGLQIETDGEWEGAFFRGARLCGAPPTVIEPDEVYHSILDIAACPVGNCGPRIRLPPAPSTPYRIKWNEALSSYNPDEDPHGELIPLKQRLSNTFALRVPR